MLSARQSICDCRGAQRGLSLVEMMVGIAVGLIVVAGASLLVSSQLGENRRLLMETQLQQDMRATMDVITRELRRIGAQREPPALESASGLMDNEMARLSPTVPGVPVDTLSFRYDPRTAEVQFGFRRDIDGVVRSRLGGNWQELTDPNVLKVTVLDITPTHSAPLVLPCPRLCPDGTTSCWPHVMVRDLKVEMTAQSRSDATVERKLTSHVRVRNDIVKFSASPSEMCPS